MVSTSVIVRRPGCVIDWPRASGRASRRIREFIVRNVRTGGTYSSNTVYNVLASLTMMASVTASTLHPCGKAGINIAASTCTSPLTYCHETVLTTLVPSPS
jgi:hypothetical protein